MAASLGISSLGAGIPAKAGIQPSSNCFRRSLKGLPSRWIPAFGNDFGREPEISPNDASALQFSVDTTCSDSIIADELAEADDGARATTASVPNSPVPPVILTIAGFDPSSGAGITADLKTFAAHNCYGVAAVTALTVQNTQGVRRLYPVDSSVLRESLEALMSDGQVRAVKIGLLANRSNAQVANEFLEAHPTLPSVLDPVLRSSSGMELVDGAGFDFVREHLLKSASLLTPNLMEAAALTGLKVEGLEDMKTAARRLMEMGARAVVVTGGHLDKAIDAYLDSEGLETFVGERLKPDNTHGTGCTFSSAVAANLALGRQLRDSVMLAKAYVAESIKKAYPIGPGRVPLNHLYRMHESPRATNHAAHSEVSA